MKLFERIIIGTLIVLMMVVVLMSTIELGWIIGQDIFTSPSLLIGIEHLFDIFGFFLIVLIGVELLETIRAYLEDHVIHAEVVVEVALIAIARKIIIMDMKELSGLTLVGIGVIILALAAVFFVMKRIGCALKPDKGSS